MFLSKREWLARIPHPSDLDRVRREVERPGDLNLYEYYAIKFEICRAARPDRIVEIGVRWGYSAFSFLSARPTASYYGVDLIDGGHGGANGVDTFPYVKELLREHFPSSAGVTLVHGDSQAMTTLPEADFIHVDGDHSYQGCLHDLIVAFFSLSSPGVLLIDDYRTHPPVRKAVDAFIRLFRRNIRSCEYVISRRGEYVIRR